IDPPYNTGNEGWVYNDNLTQPQFKEWIGQVVGKEEEDACRHDKWCCMMYPRLQLLKELLRDDGTIFVSIDDNEVQHLRMLMDDIFGVRNFLAAVAWQKVFAPKPAAKKFSTSYEYLICYAKRAEQWDRILLPRTKEQNERYSNPDNDPRGPWASDNLLRNEHRDNSVYTITAPSGKEWTPQPGTSWRHPEVEMLDLIANNEIWFGEDGNNMPRRKKFLADVQKGRVPETLWPYDEVGHTQEATREVIRILGASTKNFPYPKPTELIKRVIQITTRPGQMVLDCTAGSGTTGHAALALNAEDQGNRTFVIVQQTFDTKEHEEQNFNICQRVTAERVRRVMSGYSFKNSKGKVQKVGGLGGEFAYARLSEKPILGEDRDITKNPPAYEEIAKYIFYTETSTVWNKDESDAKTGKIGQRGSTSFYLLYTPNHRDDQALDAEFLKKVAAKDRNPNLVIYCEKIWIHRSELLEWEEAHGKRVRTMIVPFNLK
ncbi:MAG: site-specific DNA-methyltransferase, partial [Verrucomicrobia bacterium]|nr:site-specific DNA-methyltransferase [Verrucomicrobiota bacterium]